MVSAPAKPSRVRLTRRPVLQSSPLTASHPARRSCSPRTRRLPGQGTAPSQGTDPAGRATRRGRGFSVAGPALLPAHAHRARVPPTQLLPLWPGRPRPGVPLPGGSAFLSQALPLPPLPSVFLLRRDLPETPNETAARFSGLNAQPPGALSSCPLADEQGRRLATRLRRAVGDRTRQNPAGTAHRAAAATGPEAPAERARTTPEAAEVWNPRATGEGWRRERSAAFWGKPACSRSPAGRAARPRPRALAPRHPTWWTRRRGPCLLREQRGVRASTRLRAPLRADGE